MPAPAIKPLRAPALYLLAALICGFLLARPFPVAPFPLALAAAGLAVLSSFTARHSAPAWTILLLLSGTLGAWAYGTIRLPATPQDEVLELPLREATLTLRVDRVFAHRDAYDQASGIARVQQGSPASAIQRGLPVYFRMRLPENGSFELVRGQVLRLKGLLQPLSEKTSPGTFESYLKETGIHYQFSRTSDHSVLREAPPFKQICHDFNQRLQGYLKLGQPEETELTGIYIAMLLGQKAALESDQKDRFRMTGTMHLFAISGLHIGVVAAVIAQALLLIRIPRAVTPFIGLPLLYFYVEVTGAAPSAIRAFLMVTFFWCSLALNRQRDPLAAMIASAIFVLLLQPWQLWLIGFQLSYFVVFSILLLGLPLYQALAHWHRPFRDLPDKDLKPWQRTYMWIADKLLLLTAVSLSAWLMSAPLSAAHFGLIAPYAVAVNLLLVNLASLAISTGVISIACALLHAPAISWFLNHAAWVTLALMDLIVGLNLRLPFAVIECPDFPKWLGYATVSLFMAALLLANATGKNQFRFVLAPGLVLSGMLLGLMIA
jgi:competence protein ComEC